MKSPDFEKNGKISLISMLNYCSRYYGPEESKKWALEWISEHHPDLLEAVKDVNDFRFSNRGFVCHAIKNGCEVSEEIIADLVAFFKHLPLIREVSKETINELSASQAKSAPLINTLICDLEDVIDATINGDEVRELEVPVDGLKMVREAREWCEKQIIEFQEQYRRYEALITYFDRTVNRLDTLEGKPKTIKPKAAGKPKTRSQQLHDAAKLVSNMTCLSAYPEFNMKGISPMKIVGAKRVMVFNIKYRSCFVFEAIRGETLSVSGSSIRNYDSERSGIKTVRKPLEFSKSVNAGKAFSAYDSLTTRAQPIHSHVNKECILLAVE